MWGKKRDHRKRGWGLLGIFRLFWSLIILIILGVGLIQAYKAFSGYDPLKADPKSSIKSLLNSDSIYAFVTGLLSFSPSVTLDKAKQALKTDSSSDKAAASADTSMLKLEYKFAIIADSHKDTAGLTKALNLAKQSDAKFIIGIGDLSDVGTIDELRVTKNQFDIIGLPYYVTPGDHDLWDSRDKKHPAPENFNQVFGTAYQSFSYQDARILIVFNSDNYEGLDQFQLNWVEEELKRYQQNRSRLLFIIVSTPLYHPSSDHVMGKVTPKLKAQAEHLASIFKKAGADEVFAADTHFFARYQDPNTNLKMTTVGAVTSERNAQTPRFALVDVYTNGSYNIEEVEIK